MTSRTGLREKQAWRRQQLVGPTAARLASSKAAAGTLHACMREMSKQAAQHLDWAFSCSSSASSCSSSTSKLVTCHPGRCASDTDRQTDRCRYHVLHSLRALLQCSSSRALHRQCTLETPSVSMSMNMPMTAGAQSAGQASRQSGGACSRMACLRHLTGPDPRPQSRCSGMPASKHGRHPHALTTATTAGLIMRAHLMLGGAALPFQ